VEIGLRVSGKGREFFTGEDKVANAYDSIIIVGSSLELWFRAFVHNWTALGVFRVLRSLRMLRVVAKLRHLRMMIVAIAQSVPNLLWAAFFIVLTLYFFGVIFMQGVAKYVGEASSNNTNVEQLLEHFPSLPMTMLTLLMTVSGGVDWWDVAQLLLDISLFYIGVLIVFLCVMVLAAMNIITGIFVSDALEVASNDKELVERKGRVRDEETLTILRKLFLLADADDSGSISFSELETFLQRADVRAIFATHGLEVSNPMGFFRMLDVDHDAEIEIDEFVMGCMKFRGVAKTVDLETLAHQTTRMVALLRENTLELHTALISATTLLKDHMLCMENRLLGLPDQDVDMLNIKAHGQLVSSPRSH